MLAHRRASQFIRGAVAHALGGEGLLLHVEPPALPAAAPRALPSGPMPRAKRPIRKTMHEAQPFDSNGDENALDEATGNFLNAFG
jgi:hypothetical protein